MTRSCTHAAAAPRAARHRLAMAAPAAALFTAIATSALIASAAIAPGVIAQERAFPRSFADLAERVTPAVVNIATVRGGQDEDGAEAWLPFAVPEGSPYADLFRRFQEQFRQRPSPRSRALGSGFIIDPAGFIATNNHVIDQASEITVTLQDGRSFKAKLVGADKTTDLALLKIENAGDLPSVKFGDSNKARVGDWVMAVGNPFNLGGTVTVGVISARNRDLRSGPYDAYLQIDAPINRGNSGGPLFNLEGEVIGVNTAIYSPSGGNIGIGFAIPSSVAAQVLAELRANGRVRRGWLGVQIQPMTDDLAKAMGLEKARGALVAQVQSGSPAMRAGLKAGDVVLAVDGKPVESSRDLARMIAAIEPGRDVRLSLWRDRREQTVDVKLGELGSAIGQGRRDEQQQRRGGEYSFGFRLGELTDRARDAYNIPDSVNGVLIARVVPGSAAAEQGLQAGDVIIAVDNQPAENVPTVIDKLNEAKKADKAVVLLISRQGTTRFVVLKAQKG